MRPLCLMLFAMLVPIFAGCGSASTKETPEYPERVTKPVQRSLTPLESGRRYQTLERINALYRSIKKE